MSAAGTQEVLAPLAGRVVALEEVADEVFAGRVMGDGAAIEPTDGRVIAPVSGRLAKLFPGGHGLAIETASGLQVLVHIGLDTVELKGEGFTVHATEGDEVAAGEHLVTADLEHLRGLGKDVVTPVVVLSEHVVDVVAQDEVAAGEVLLRITG